MAIHLSDRFTYGRLLRFTLPAVAMSLFTSVYSVADGWFVSNYAGKEALAAVTLVFPLLGVLGAAGFMLGAGGCAHVGRLLGEGRRREARQAFSLCIYATLALGTLLALVGQLVLEPLMACFGASGGTLAQSVLYGRISLLSLPCFMLQFCFQPFFACAERPRLGLAVTVGAGLANIALDALLVAGLGWGLAGAAMATAASEALGGLAPLACFARARQGQLALGRPLRAHRAWRFLAGACANGCSEFLINIAFPLLTCLYNWRLMHLAGEDGVAAFGAQLYISYFFTAVFLGYALGNAPIISFNAGAGTLAELDSVFRKSLVLNALAGLVLAGLCLALAGPLAACYAGYDQALCALARRAIALLSPTFLIGWINIWGSAFFTAIGRGLASGLIASLRTLVFGSLAVLCLPKVLGLDGVWLGGSCAELACLGVTCLLLVRARRERAA